MSPSTSPRPGRGPIADVPLWERLPGPVRDVCQVSAERLCPGLSPRRAALVERCLDDVLETPVWGLADASYAVSHLIGALNDALWEEDALRGPEALVFWSRFWAAAAGLIEIAPADVDALMGS